MRTFRLMFKDTFSLDAAHMCPESTTFQQLVHWIVYASCKMTILSLSLRKHAYSNNYIEISPLKTENFQMKNH